MSDKADALWRRFVGFFGGDAVARKYGAEPPAEWVAMLSRLTDFELERGMRRLVFSGKAHVPTLPEFVKLCREVGGDAESNAPGQQQALPAPHPMDRWAAAGSQHLFAHILAQAKRGKHYACEATRGLRRDVKTLGASRETEHLTQPLIDGKNAWIDEMRSLELAREIPADNGRALWEEIMANADIAVAAVRRDFAQERAA